MTGSINAPSSTELRTFIDRVIVPALLERFLREHAVECSDAAPVTTRVTKTDATV